MDGFCLFDTAIGPCGIVWSEHGIVAVQLPEGDRDATRARLIRRHPLVPEATPPDEIAGTVARIQRLLMGERVDLDDVAVHMPAATPFELRVYDAARDIRAGHTLTYGEVAQRIGSPRAAREVGAALGRNPVPIIVPCHRVIAANGKTGGFSGGDGVRTKLRMLAIEGGGGPLFEQS
jgi:methylated-DNA-[protein]-cysteine S-methyltransferase